MSVRRRNVGSDVHAARHRPRGPSPRRRVAASRPHRRLAAVALTSRDLVVGGLRRGGGRHLPRHAGRGLVGPGAHDPAGRAARAVRGRCRPARHGRADHVVGGGRPCRGPAACRPPGRRAAPAARGADRAGSRRGPRPGRRRHPRGRGPAPAECLAGDPHRPGLRSAVAGRRVDLVAGLPALPARRCGGVARRTPSAAGGVGPQGRGGGRVDRPRCRAGGRRRRARRPARQWRPGTRAAAVHRARSPDAPPLLRGPRARGQDRSPHRPAAPRRARGHRTDRCRAGRRRPPRHRRAGHALPGHHHVRRPGRPARSPPSRPAGRLRCGAAAAGPRGRRARGRGWR